MALILIVSTAVVLFVIRGRWRRSWSFFLLGAGFMLLETKSIIQFALLWGSTWVVASLAIASVLSMALVANYVVLASRSCGHGSVAAQLALLALNFLIRWGRCFQSQALESLFYAVLMFSPILCAGLLFGSAISARRRCRATTARTCSGRWWAASARMLSLVTGFRMLLLVIALCYIRAIATLRRSA